MERRSPRPARGSQSPRRSPQRGERRSAGASQRMPPADAGQWVGAGGASGQGVGASGPGSVPAGAAAAAALPAEIGGLGPGVPAAGRGCGMCRRSAAGEPRERLVCMIKAAGEGCSAALIVHGKIVIKSFVIN